MYQVQRLVQGLGVLAPLVVVVEEVEEVEETEGEYLVDWASWTYLWT